MNIPMSDNDAAAWEFFKFFYGKSLIDLGKDKQIRIHGNTIYVNGDVCFNFLYKNQKGTLMLLPSIFPEKFKKDAQDIHESLNHFRYSFLNISVLPKTGGLNVIKKSYAEDRFDSFIYLLSQYYEGVTVPIGNRGSLGSDFSAQEELMDFLNSVGSAKNFVKHFYVIKDDDVFIESMCDSGPKAICTCGEYLDYMELAISFWRKRLDLLNNRSNYTKSDMRGYYEEIILPELDKYKIKLDTLEKEINTFREKLTCK